MGDSSDSRDAEIGLLSGQVRRPPAGHLPIKTTWRTATVTLLILTALLAVIFVTLHESAQDFAFLDNMRGAKSAPVNVLVVGDWGREGNYNQSLVASQMGRVGHALDVDFIVSSGDNFYDSGLTRLDDPLFDESFSEVYKAPSLQKSWYAVLGNHDYRGNPEVQVDEQLRIQDPRWYCNYTYTLPLDLGNSENGASISRSVEFFFIDTNPMVEEYWTTENSKYTWTRSTPREEVIAEQLKYLAAALETSTAAWKLVVGHHTMFSDGSHGDTPELIEKVLPVLEEFGVDMYINGHDHCLQHIKRTDSNVHFVTSGGGSKAWKGEFQISDASYSKLYYDGQGFISLSIAPHTLLVYFYDIFGQIIHEISLRK